MAQRQTVTPALVEQGSLSLDEVLAHLRAWRADTLESVRTLGTLREEVTARTPRLESPNAVQEYVQYFIELFEHVAADLERIVLELPRAVKRRDLDDLRQIASNAGADQRRCLQFRDKWINRPLPYEEVRPMLSAISKATKDQLTDYRDLFKAADSLQVLAAQPPSPGSPIGRRALFTRLIGREEEDGT